MALSIVTAKKDVGSYTATASCSSVTGGQAKCDNYTLTSTTKGFEITKATGSVSLNETSGTLTYGTNKTVTITKTGDGSLSCSSSDTSVATCSISGTTLTITPVANTADGKTATITVTLSAGSNYNGATATYAATVNRKITKTRNDWER